MNKNIYWQNIRGICIIAVILIHCTDGLSAVHSNIYSYDSMYYIIMRNIVNFPVPLFLFISGYFTNIDMAKTDLKTFYKKKLARLILPFIIWTTFYNAYNVITKILKHEPVKTMNIIKSYFTGGATSHLYFIVLLLIFILVTPLLVKALNSKAKSILLCSMSGALLTVIYISNIVFLSDKYDFLAKYILIVFYYFGLYCKNNDFHLTTKVNKKTVVGLFTFAFVFNIVETYLLLYFKVNSQFSFSQATIGGILYAFAIIALLLINKRDVNKHSILSYIGDNSFGIYFIHLFWLSIIKNIFRIANITLPFIFINQIIELIGALGLSIVTIFIVKKIFGKKTSNLAFGF